MKVGIYLIRRVATGKVLYVGRYGDPSGPDRRWAEHWAAARAANRAREAGKSLRAFQRVALGLAKSLRTGDEVRFELVEEVDTADPEMIAQAEWAANGEREVFWIAHHGTFEDRTCWNVTKGGEGVLGFSWTEEQLARHPRRTPEGRAKVTAANRAPETRARNRATWRAKAKDPEVRARLAAQSRNAWLDPAYREVQRERARERWNDSERRARMGLKPKASQARWAEVRALGLRTLAGLKVYQATGSIEAAREADAATEARRREGLKQHFGKRSVKVKEQNVTEV